LIEFSLQTFLVKYSSTLWLH